MIHLIDEHSFRLHDHKISTENATELPERSKENKISILSDVMLKAMFQNENRIKYSCKFISYYIDISYEVLLDKLRLGKNELDKKKVTDKTERCDYVAYINDCALNIEVNNNADLLTLERNLEYAFRLYSKNVKVGEKYKYTQVIQFNINNFAFEGNDNIEDIEYFRLNDGTITFDKLAIVNIYVPNLNKKCYTVGIENLSEKERFLLTLTEPNIQKSFEFGEGHQIMREYVDEAIEASNDDSIGEAYDKEWAAIETGRHYGMEQGIEIGKQEGIETGKEIGKKQIIKKMLQENMDVNLIVKIVEVDLEKIEACKKELEKEA